MNSAVFQKIELITKLSPNMGGVFSTTDLKAIFNESEQATFYNTISTLVELGILSRFSRGLYVCKNYSPLMLSARIDPNAYISMGSVLAHNGLIGTNPEMLLTCIRVGKRRTYSGKNLEIRHYGISKELYFGFSLVEGIKVADNEKAYLDLLYYRMRGERYSFDELNDIDLERLDIKKCLRYLRSYRNKKFVKFCMSQINGEPTRN